MTRSAAGKGAYDDSGSGGACSGDGCAVHGEIYCAQTLAQKARGRRVRGLYGLYGLRLFLRELRFMLPRGKQNANTGKNAKGRKWTIRERLWQFAKKPPYSSKYGQQCAEKMRKLLTKAGCCDIISFAEYIVIGELSAAAEKLKRCRVRSVRKRFGRNFYRR